MQKSHRAPSQVRIALPLLGLTALVGLTAWGMKPQSSGAQTLAVGKAVSGKGNLTFTDLQGRQYSAQDIAAHKATVFLFVSTQCPVSNVYTPRFKEVAEAYAKQGVQVFAVYSNTQESLAEVTRHSKERGLTFPVIKDNGSVLADRLGAKMTPEAIVVDAKGAVQYRGRIDDNSVATRVTVHDLNDALDAVLAGKPVAHPEMLAIGCVIRRDTRLAVAAKGVPTYSHDVAAIMRAKCEGCHRPGEVAPFSLQTYQQASAWAPDIKKYTQNRQMPPWKPAPGYGEFKDEHVINLTEAERTTLAKWVDAGAPLGNPKEIPAPRQFTSDWKLGEPDRILTAEKAYQLSSDGDDVYRNFVIKSNFTEDRFLSAVEVRPDNRAVVHHVIVFIDGNPDPNGVYASEKLESGTQDGQPGYNSFGGPGFVPSGITGGWAPGNEAQFLPDGLGVFVPRNARFVIQVHYHKDGKPETDHTKIGLHFCRSTVQKKVDSQFVLNFGFQIPPGAERHEVTASTTVSQDSHLFAVTPHMHLLGREMKVWATLPDGTDKPLVWIKDWDFNWQNTYYLKEPMALPKGSKVHLTAYYDNSDKNPRNPNRTSPKTVGWGEQTTDEMCVAFIAYTRDAEHLAYTPPAAPIKTASQK